MGTQTTDPASKAEAVQDSAQAEGIEPPLATAQNLAAIQNARRQLGTDKKVVQALSLPPAAGLKPGDRLGLFGDLDAIAKAADAIAKRAKDLRRDAEEGALTALDELGLKNAPIAGGPTIYRARELWAGNDVDEDADDEEKAHAYDRAFDALHAAGLGDYAQRRYNASSLSAYFRDRERELEQEIRERDGLDPDDPVAVDPDELIPEALKGVIRIAEKITVKAKAS